MPIAKRDLILAGGTIAAVLGVLFFARGSRRLRRPGRIRWDPWRPGRTGPGRVRGGALRAGGRRVVGRPARPVDARALGRGSVCAGRRRRRRPRRPRLAGQRHDRRVASGSGRHRHHARAIAALVVRAAADPDQPLVLPFPVAYVAVVLTGIALLLALQHSVRLADQEVGAENWIPQLIYVAGAAIALIGGDPGGAGGRRELDARVARARGRRSRLSRAGSGGHGARDSAFAHRHARSRRSARRRPRPGSRAPSRPAARPPRSSPTGPRSARAHRR